jgi:hypothetical protein
MQTDSLMVVLLFVAGLSLYCLLYTALLWLLMRIQRLDYTVPKLLLAAAITTAVAQIPWVGAYLSVLVLLVCLRRFTGEAILPGLVLTVVVAAAFMFAANLWLLAAMFPDTISVRQALTRLRAEAAVPNEKALPVTVINLDDRPPTVVDPADGTSAPGREPSVQGVVLKGVSISRQEQFVLVGSGHKSQPLKAGEHLSFDTPAGPVDVQCESVESNRVWMQIRGPKRWERVELRFKPPVFLPIPSSTNPVANPAPAP